MSTTISLSAGDRGTAGFATMQEPPSETKDPFESSSVSPRAIRIPTDSLTRLYQDEGHVEVTRFLMNQNEVDVKDRELEVFQRAITYLDKNDSAELIFQKFPTPPRRLSCSSVVLVDMKDARNSGFHTVCLWKRTNEHFLIIDPSNHTFSERLLEDLALLNRQFLTKKHTANKFYEDINGDKSDKQRVDNDENIDWRDCIDIAVKIAFSINFFFNKRI